MQGTRKKPENKAFRCIDFSSTICYNEKRSSQSHFNGPTLAKESRMSSNNVAATLISLILWTFIGAVITTVLGAWLIIAWRWLGQKLAIWMNSRGVGHLVVIFVATGILSGCVVHAPLPGDGRRVSFTPPSMGGKSVLIFNNVRDTKMDCEIVGISYSGDVLPKKDSEGNSYAETGDALRFFLGHIAFRDRREANILCRFTPSEGPKQYLGMKEIRVSISNRGGQYESKVVEINRFDQPNRVRLRD